MATKSHTHNKVEAASTPYSVSTRRERSRALAQRRRTTYKSIMTDLADALPFSKDVVSQVDYNSRLRLALCFFRMKSLLETKGDEEFSKSVTEYEEKPLNFYSGMLQDFMIEALDGFLIVVLTDGTIVYLSDSIHKHLGLFQSEHIGYSIYDLVLDEDHSDVKSAISKSDMLAMSNQGTSKCFFFCRMKCSRFKVANTATKSPGYKLVYVSGYLRVSGTDDPFLVAMVRPVGPPSILEIRMEGNMFVTHYSMEFRCTFYDGRLRHLLGFKKSDLVGHVPFEFHHHGDTEATVECSRGVMSKGEGLSSYYRFMNQYGQYLWMQSRATLMFDSRTGNPSYIVCMNFIISKEEGEKSLSLRQAITSGSKIQESTQSHHPFPIPREDGEIVNPLDHGETTRMSTPSPVEEPTSTFNDDCSTSDGGIQSTTSPAVSMELPDSTSSDSRKSVSPESGYRSSISKDTVSGSCDIESEVSPPNPNCAFFSPSEAASVVSRSTCSPIQQDCNQTFSPQGKLNPDVQRSSQQYQHLPTQNGSPVQRLYSPPQLYSQGGRMQQHLPPGPPQPMPGFVHSTVSSGTRQISTTTTPQGKYGLDHHPHASSNQHAYPSPFQHGSSQSAVYCSQNRLSQQIQNACPQQQKACAAESVYPQYTTYMNGNFFEGQGFPCSSQETTQNLALLTPEDLKMLDDFQDVSSLKHSFT